MAKKHKASGALPGLEGAEAAPHLWGILRVGVHKVLKAATVQTRPRDSNSRKEGWTVMCR